MKFKGTKGPLTVTDSSKPDDNNPGERFGRIEITCARGKSFAQIFPYNTKYTNDYETSKANAQLIAAAPELAESIIDFLEWIKPEIDSISNREVKEDWIENLEPMKQAINKALGK